MEFAILCIFLPTGKTFTFRNVTIVCDNETILQFAYKAMSDGQDKLGTFPKSGIAGWALTPKKGG